MGRSRVILFYARALLCVAIAPHIVQSLLQQVGHVALSDTGPRSTFHPTGRIESLTSPPFIAVAVLRDIKVEDILRMGQVLHRAGFRAMSITADTPGFEHLLRTLHHGRDTWLTEVVFGASSVATPEQVEKAHKCGAKFVSSVVCDADVVRRTKELGITSIPGVASVAEAAVALEVGADILKIYPATTTSQVELKSIVESVSSLDVPVVVAGGVEVEQLKGFSDSNVSGFAVGRTLLAPGMSAPELEAKAVTFIEGGNRFRWAQHNHEILPRR